jgi:uracil phosphoribosyltransferase
MGYEVTKDLPTEPHEVETPLERMTGTQVAGKKLCSCRSCARDSAWWMA